MFRRPGTQLRKVTEPLWNQTRRGTARAQSNILKNPKGTTPRSPFWSTGKVLLITGTTGLAAYTYGVSGTTSPFPFLETKSKAPKYASKSQMEKASSNWKSLGCFKGLMGIPGY